MNARQPLHVDIAGSGPAIVLVHGAGGSPESDYPFIDQLADRFTVVAAALPGIGSSELGTEPLTVDSVADRLIAALDQNGIGACILIGYSLGSTVVVRAAEMLGDRASGVILCAGFVRAKPSLVAAAALWEHLLDAPTHVLGRFLLKETLREDTIDANGTSWLNENAQLQGSASDRAATRAHLALLRTADVGASLKSSTYPLLVVIPREDRLVAQAHSDVILRLRPDARQVWLPSGHALGTEAPDGWFTAITKFVADIQATPAWQSENNMTPIPTASREAS